MYDIAFYDFNEKKNQIKKKKNTHFSVFLSILKFISQHHVFAVQINISPVCLESIKWKIVTKRGMVVNSLMVMMNCFCGMVDQRKAFSLISSRDHCLGSSPLGIFDMPQARFEPAQNLSSDFVELSCAVVITTTPLCHEVVMLFKHKSAYHGKQLLVWKKRQVLQIYGRLCVKQVLWKIISTFNRF